MIFSISAITTGSNIKVVAMFEIHMLSTAEAVINPKTSRRPLPPPNNPTMLRAIRRWAPLRSIAEESIKPPSKSRINGLPYASPTWVGEITPTSGKTASGIKLVAGIGIGSKIHQQAVSMVIPAVHAIPLDHPARDKPIPKPSATSGPATRVQCFIAKQSPSKDLG